MWVLWSNVMSRWNELLQRFNCSALTDEVTPPPNRLSSLIVQGVPPPTHTHTHKAAVIALSQVLSHTELYSLRWMAALPVATPLQVLYLVILD